MPEPRVPGSRRLAYAAGMFGSSLPINLVRGSILLYYVDTLGMDATAYGIVMVVYAIVDAIDNPLFGHLSDGTRTRLGRRRPWLLVAVPSLVAVFVALFSAPTSLDGAALVAWFAVFVILTEAADSLYNANYTALLPELFRTEAERSVVNAVRQAFQLAAMVVSVALTPALTTRWLGSEHGPEGFTRTAVLLGVVALLVMGAMVLSVREDAAVQHEPPTRFLPAIGGVLRTRELWLIGATTAGYGAALGLLISGIQLWMRYTLERPVAMTTPVLGAAILTAAAVLPAWAWLVRRVGAPRAWRWALTWLAVSFLPLWFVTSVPLAVVAAAVVGVGYGGVLATTDLVTARVLDRDARLTGLHREGVFLGTFGVFARLTGALGGLALATLEPLFGYVSGDDPGERPGLAFRVYTCLYPAALVGIAAVAARFVRVDDEVGGRPGALPDAPGVVDRPGTRTTPGGPGPRGTLDQ
ncbi:MFS transporter [Georgenia sp. Z1491]|uniref:MFS transporter n=1 Tax=Georgenia sp. Z1491 TaxID=3416707 RepID=UPI003CE990EC